MTILRMIDASTPPDLAAAKAAGIEAVGFYVGGETPHVWTDAEMEPVWAFTGQVPIYVPPQSPGYYTALTGARDAGQYEVKHSALVGLGMSPDAALTVDIEAAMFGANAPGVSDYLGAWTTALEADGVPCGVYAPAKAFEGWPAVPGLAWVSAWQADSGQWSGAWPTAVSSTFGRSVDAWQFAAGITLPGIGTVDLSVVSVAEPAVQASPTPVAPTVAEHTVAVLVDGRQVWSDTYSA